MSNRGKGKNPFEDDLQSEQQVIVKEQNQQQYQNPFDDDSQMEEQIVVQDQNQQRQQNPFDDDSRLEQQIIVQDQDQQQQQNSFNNDWQLQQKKQMVKDQNQQQQQNPFDDDSQLEEQIIVQDQDQYQQQNPYNNDWQPQQQKNMAQDQNQQQLYGQFNQNFQWDHKPQQLQSQQIPTQQREFNIQRNQQNGGEKQEYMVQEQNQKQLQVHIKQNSELDEMPQQQQPQMPFQYKQVNIQRKQFQYVDGQESTWNQSPMPHNHQDNKQKPIITSHDVVNIVIDDDFAEAGICYCWCQMQVWLIDRCCANCCDSSYGCLDYLFEKCFDPMLYCCRSAGDCLCSIGERCGDLCECFRDICGLWKMIQIFGCSGAMCEQMCLRCCCCCCLEKVS